MLVSLNANRPAEQPMRSFVRFSPFLNFCYLLSFVSICTNTPTNYCMWTNWIYVLFSIDLVLTCIFIVDLYPKITRSHRIVWQKAKRFDTFLVSMHLLSLITHVSTRPFL